MATSDDRDPDDWGREYCPTCERDTEHDRTLDVREPRDGYGRDPHRVATCQECGTEKTERISG